MTAGHGDGKDHSILEENIRRRSRFGLMMEAVQQRRPLHEMMHEFEGLDYSTYKVLCAIRDGTISKGDSFRVMHCVKHDPDRKERNLKRAFLMFDHGMTARQVAEKLGYHPDYGAHLRALWGYEHDSALRRIK